MTTNEVDRYPRMTGLQASLTYKEHELSEDDEYLFCDDCNTQYHGDCPVHGPLSELQTGVGYDHASMTYTQVPVPVQVTVKPSSISGAGLGVFSTTTIKKGVRMGPYEGERISKSDMGELCDTAYAWEIHQNGSVHHFVDGQNPALSNWMRFVNCARNDEEQNLQAYQYHGNIYYRSLNTIDPHTELLVWYGDHYAKELGISIQQGAANAKEKSDNFNGNNQEQQNDQKISSSCVNGKKYSKNPNSKSRPEEKLYKCRYCKYRFARRTDLQRHIKTHEEKPYKCDYCEYRFSRRSLLQTHTRTHTGEKPYKCDSCEFACIQRYDLKVHIRTHTNEKPYKCDSCEYSCIRKSYLQQHLLTHSGEKPYKCDYCGNRYSWKICLQRHIVTHTGEKPYKCDYCECRFAWRSQLQRHTKTHTEEKTHIGTHFKRSPTRQQVYMLPVQIIVSDSILVAR